MSQDSRTRNTVRNIIVGTIAKVVSTLLPFITRTVMIRALGAEYAGLGSLFLAVLQVLNVTELGFASAITFKMYKPIAENNNAETCEWLTLYRSIYHKIGITIAFLGIIIIPFLPFFIKKDVPADINIYLVYCVYLFNSVISYFLFSYKRSVLFAYQRQDLLSNVEMSISVVQSLIQTVVLLVFRRYYFYVICLPIFTILSNVLVGIISFRKYPELRCNNTVNRQKFSEIRNYVKGIAIGKFSRTTRNSFDSIVLATFCGLTSVTIYSNYYYLFTSVVAFSSIIINSITASVGNKIALESREENSKDHSFFDFWFMWITGWFTTCFFCLYQHFMAIWVGDELVAPFHTMMLFCIYFYVHGLSQIRGVYSETSGLWWKLRYISLGEMIANILLNILLGYYFEMDGIIVATIITTFVADFVANSVVTFRHYFMKSSIMYFVDNVVYALGTAITMGVTYSICRNIEVPGVWGLFVKGSICVFLPNVIFCGIYYVLPRYRKNMARAIMMKKTM